jgi:hypothetical protein
MASDKGTRASKGKARVTRGSTEIHEECARLFQKRTGAPWDPKFRTEIERAMRVSTHRSEEKRAVRDIVNAFDRLERLSHESDGTDDARLVASRCASPARRAIKLLAKLDVHHHVPNMRVELLLCFDEPSFFGTHRQADDKDLAIVSILAGIAGEFPNGTRASIAIDNERKTIRKLRKKYGLSRRGRVGDREKLRDSTPYLARMLERLRSREMVFKNATDPLAQFRANRDALKNATDPLAQFRAERLKDASLGSETSPPAEQSLPCDIEE